MENKNAVFILDQFEAHMTFLPSCMFYATIMLALVQRATRIILYNLIQKDNETILQTFVTLRNYNKTSQSNKISKQE